jgi:hypothetical protein
LSTRPPTPSSRAERSSPRAPQVQRSPSTRAAGGGTGFARRPRRPASRFRAVGRGTDDTHAMCAPAPAPGPGCLCLDPRGARRTDVSSMQPGGRGHLGAWRSPSRPRGRTHARTRRSHRRRARARRPPAWRGRAAPVRLEYPESRLRKPMSTQRGVPSLLPSSASVLAGNGRRGLPAGRTERNGASTRPRPPRTGIAASSLEHQTAAGSNRRCPTCGRQVSLARLPGLGLRLVIGFMPKCYY